VTKEDTASGMTSDARHVYGARSLGALVPKVTRPAFRRRAPATAQVLSDWPAIVGPAIAAVAVPRRLVSGTLTITCTGPIAMELQYLGGELLGRINTHLGGQVVTGLRFVQTVAPADPAPAPELRLKPDPADMAKAAAAVAGLADGELRTALAALGSAMLARAKLRRPADTRSKRG
jgi:hypothetical protein